MMQCVDCHNRPTHAFELPDRAVDRAMSLGLLPTTLPFLKKKSVELLKADYASNDEAEQRIPAALSAYYRQAYPKVASERKARRGRRPEELVRIYDTNVFPDLGVGWGLTRTTSGHEAFPGLLPLPRRAAQGRRRKDHHPGLRRMPRSRRQEESSPEVLKTLGLEARILALRKP